MYGHSTAWYDDVVQWHIRINSLNDLNRFCLINSVSEEQVFWKMVITYAKGVTYLWIWIISWCWWNLLTSANHMAQIASCDRSRIHAPDLGRTGVCPGKNSFHKKCKKKDDIAVCVITFFYVHVHDVNMKPTMDNQPGPFWDNFEHLPWQYFVYSSLILFCPRAVMSFPCR